MRLRTVKTNKIRRDAKAFAARVKMSRTALFLVVEGRVTDRAFYDRVLGGYAPLDGRGYSVILGEELELDGRTGGGKTFLMELHDYWEGNGVLSQVTRSGIRNIVVAADRDYDEPTQLLRSSRHVLYTYASDAEAEILHQCDLPSVAAAVYSLPVSTVAPLVPSAPVIFTMLTRLWRRWILYGICCVASAHGGRYSCLSLFNVGGTGRLNGQVEREMLSELKKAINTSVSRAEIVASVVTGGAMLDSTEGWRLIKGKWVAKFVAETLTSGLSAELLEVGIKADSLTKAALASIQFSGAWLAPYYKQLDRLGIPMV
jgi:hypothetical protein